MKSETVKKKFEKLISEFKKDDDVYCLVHFSREDNNITGIDNTDGFDVLIVIQELIKKHKLSSEVIAAMNINPVKSITDN